MAKNSSENKTQEQILAFLEENPSLKNALNIFNVSNEDYIKAIELNTRKQILTTFNTTNSNGNLA